MKFYNKRSSCISIENSKTLNEIFYNLFDYEIDTFKENYVFILQEDKVLQSYSDDEILNLSVDIVPNKKKKRMPYNFENFEDLYECLKQNRAIPYAGEDLF